MNRPGGIVATVVLLSLGAVACFGFTAIMAFVLFFTAAMPEAATPPVPLIFRLFSIGLFAALGIWTLATAVGVWKLKPWGRVSMLLFSGLLVFMQGLGALMFCFLPFPEMDPRTNQIMAMVRVFMVLFYLVQVAIGVWWLVYFNRPGIKAVFAGEAPPSERPARPLSITVIAWHLVVAGLFCLLMAWVGWPAVFFGMVFRGWAAAATYLLLGSLTGFLGLCLLKLHPRAVDWTIWYFCFAGVNTSIFWIFGDPQQAAQEMLAEMRMPDMQTGQPIPTMPVWFSLVTVLVSLAVPLWYLVRRRAAYHAASQAAAESSSS